MRDGMVDRLKVISDLEEQIAWIRDNDFHKFPGWGHAVLAMRDAIALLKAQEPRVLTLDEVDTLADNGIVWLECLYYIDGKKVTTMKPAIYQCDNSSPEEDGYYCVVSSWGKSGYYHKDNYSGDWRIWTSRPTDEQREATPWEI